MKDLTIIIPVNEFNQIVEEYLEKSVKSCEAAGTDATKVFVGPKEVLDNLKKRQTIPIGNMSIMKNQTSPHKSMLL